MKFTVSLLALLNMGTQVLAAPLLSVASVTSLLTPSSGSVVSTIDGALGSLEGSVTGSVQAIGAFFYNIT